MYDILNDLSVFLNYFSPKSMLTCHWKLTRPAEAGEALSNDELTHRLKGPNARHRMKISSPIVRHDASQSFDERLNLSQRSLLLLPLEGLPFRAIDFYN